jgi:high-affinity nickel-transport protein
VTAIVSRERTARGAMMIGLLWGIGHSLTVLVTGGAILVFGLVVPPRLGLSMEFSVAVMLVLLGTINLTGAVGRIHEAAGHGQHKPAPDRLRGVVRPLVVGIVHGLAGSAAVALLVLTTLKEVGSGLLYLGVFGAGTVAGMMLLTLALALPVAALSQRFGTLERRLAQATGLASIAFGLFLAYQIGFVDGLFLAEPSFSPR